MWLRAVPSSFNRICVVRWHASISLLSMARKPQ